MSAYNQVETMLRDGMVKGQMHVTLRDAGRLAGGLMAGGQLTIRDLSSLESLAVQLSINEREGRSKWREAVEYGRNDPLRPNARRFDDGAVGFGWDDTIHIGPSTERPVIDPNWTEAVDIPAPSENWQPNDMIAYLELMFEPDERVGLVINAWKHESGKWLPNKGIWDRTREELCIELRKHSSDIGAVIGDINEECGAWVRINPLDGEGAKDANVTAFRHTLIEADDQDLGKQLALIRDLRLPCTAIVHSGGKSIHALVRVDATDPQDYRRRVDRLYEVCQRSGLKVDNANRNPSRLSRLPGVIRNGNPQYLIDGKCGCSNFDEWIAFVEDMVDQLPDPESLATVWDNLPPLAPEVIKGVLRQGHKMLLAGPSKSAKSFGQMEFCVAVAEGLPWLGWECTQGNVLYVNLELDRASCLHRFKAIYNALAIKPANLARIDIWNLRGSAVPLDKLAPKLIRRAQKNQYIAVVIDPIYKVLTGDENSAEEMAKFCNNFDRIAAELNAATIYAHHHSKGSQGAKRAIDRASGSGVFGRDPDAVLDLIELEISEDRRKALDDAMSKQALYTLADDLGLDLSKAEPDTWKNGEDSLCVFQRAFPDHAEAARLARLAAHLKCQAMSGWRIEASLREFATPEHRRIWFQYPIHIGDEYGLLLDAKASGEEPPWMADRRAKEELRREQAKEKADALVTAIESCGGPGKATVKDVAEAMGVDQDTVRRRIKKVGQFLVKHGLILEDESDDN